jgi:hypothetical protein
VSGPGCRMINGLIARVNKIFGELTMRALLIGNLCDCAIRESVENTQETGVRLGGSDTTDLNQTPDGS